VRALCGRAATTECTPVCESLIGDGAARTELCVRLLGSALPYAKWTADYINIQQSNKRCAAMCREFGLDQYLKLGNSLVPPEGSKTWADLWEALVGMVFVFETRETFSDFCAAVGFVSVKPSEAEYPGSPEAGPSPGLRSGRKPSQTSSEQEKLAGKLADMLCARGFIGLQTSESVLGQIEQALSPVASGGSVEDRTPVVRQQAVFPTLVDVSDTVRGTDTGTSRVEHSVDSVSVDMVRSVEGLRVPDDCAMVSMYREDLPVLRQMYAGVEGRIHFVTVHEAQASFFPHVWLHRLKGRSGSSGDLFNQVSAVQAATTRHLRTFRYVCEEDADDLVVKFLRESYRTTGTVEEIA